MKKRKNIKNELLIDELTTYLMTILKRTKRNVKLSFLITPFPQNVNELSFIFYQREFDATP